MIRRLQVLQRIIKNRVIQLKADEEDRFLRAGHKIVSGKLVLSFDSEHLGYRLRGVGDGLP